MKNFVSLLSYMNRLGTANQDQEKQKGSVKTKHDILWYFDMPGDILLIST